MIKKINKSVEKETVDGQLAFEEIFVGKWPKEFGDYPTDEEKSKYLTFLNNCHNSPARTLYIITPCPMQGILIKFPNVNFEKKIILFVEEDRENLTEGQIYNLDLTVEGIRNMYDIEVDIKYYSSYIKL